MIVLAFMLVVMLLSLVVVLLMMVLSMLQVVDVVPTSDSINADIMKAASTVPIIKLSLLFH